MTGGDLTLLLSVFLASSVEAVEALTVVLAVGSSRSWRSSLLGAGGAIASLSALVAIFGPALAQVPIDALRAIVGVFLLLFGLQWLRKALLRAGGLLPVHDEELAFARERSAAQLAASQRSPIDRYSLAISFKAVALEGLEVILIVITFGAAQRRLGLATLAALAAVLVVACIGFAVRAPLARVPENLLKLTVGIMLTAFGAFWSAEGVGAAWPGGEAALPILVVLVLGCSLALVANLRSSRSDAASDVVRARARLPLGEPASFLFGDDGETLLGVGAVLGLTALLSTVSAAWYAVPPGVLVLLWLSVRRRAQLASG